MSVRLQNGPWQGAQIWQTLRTDGVSRPPFDSFNLGLHVGDDPACVLHNRARLQELIGAQQLVFMQQVHGSAVQYIGPEGTGDKAPVCDALVTDVPGLALCVMTADCLPMILVSADGRAAAAVHCGWRSLADGIAHKTVDKMRELTAAPLFAWLGPAIGPLSFEVGAEVKARFAQNSRAQGDCFVPRAQLPGRFLGDLYSLARLQLLDAGVTRVSSWELDTAAHPELFFSFRRDGRTGRMASVVMLSERQPPHCAL